MAFTYDVKHLERLWASGITYPEIAAALGCRATTVYELKVRHNLPDRKRRQIKDKGDPTPEEIAERAAELKAKHLEEMRALG